MATTPERIFVNGDAHVYIGPVGTAAPTDPAGAYNSSLIEVGLFTDDSLKFSTSPNFETVTSHQSNYPTRRMQTADEATLECDLQEWSGQNFKNAFGGGSVTETAPSSGIWKYTPPALGARNEVMVVVKCIDGSKIYSLVIPRAMQVEGVEQALGKGNASILPLRLAILGSGSADPWYWLAGGDNAAWTPSAGTATAIAPATGLAAGGYTATITGTGLSAVTAVTFGGVAATGVAHAGDTTLYVTVPAHAAGAVTVVLTHPAGDITKPAFFTYT